MLIAIDEALLAMELDVELTKRGHRIAGPFASCTATLAWLRSGTPDCAILDIDMRDAACGDIAAALEARGIPAIALTTQPGADRSDRPMVRWLDKPINLPRIVRIVEGG